MTALAIVAGLAHALLPEAHRRSALVADGGSTSPFDYMGRGLVSRETSPVYNPDARPEVVLVNPGKKHPRFVRRSAV